MANTGDRLELEVYDRLREEVGTGKIGVSPELAKVRHKASYYSRDRASQIVTDVSIEVFWAGAATPWLLWVWECKDYTHPVPVDDVEEFHAKLEQIGADKTKGTIVTRHRFQKSALSYAEAKGLGLARLRPDGSLVRLMEERRKPAMTSPTYRHGLLAPDAEALESMFYGLSTTGEYTVSLEELVRLELGKSPRA